MQKHRVLLIFLNLLICIFCSGQSNIGISSAGFLTSLPPETPILISPADLEANQPITISLSWLSQIHTSSYSIEVSKQSDFSSLAMDQANLTDTTFSISGLEHNTIYYWRVNAQNVAGNSDYSIVHSFTTIDALPEAPFPIEPANGAVNIPVDVAFKWNVIENAESYSLEVSTISDFTNLVVDQTGLTNTSYSASGLENNTSYYWRVSATNVAGTSEYSSAWEFTTIVALPETPTLAEPANNAINISTDTLLKWNLVAGADSYSLQVSKTSGFSTLVVDESNLTATIYSLSGLENNINYYWRVKAINVAGESSFSTVWNFKTVNATSVGWDIGSPGKSVLVKAFPNPFDHILKIKFQLPKNGKTELLIYNIIGQPVRVLLSESLPSGEYSVIWDGCDNMGKPVESGLYILVLKSQYNVFTQKLLRK